MGPAKGSTPKLKTYIWPILSSRTKIKTNMKTLFLIRHAEAVEGGVRESDFERLLTQHGMFSAVKTAEQFKKHEWQVDQMLISPARRTEMTARLISEQLEVPTEKIQLIDDLYNGTVRVLMREICQVKKDIDQLVIVAHHPGIPYLAEMLTDQNVGYLQPAGIIRIDFDIDSWEEVSQGTGTLKAVIQEENF